MARKSKAVRKQSANGNTPHSWDLEHWPTDIYPHTVGRARYLIRAHRNDLLAAGALTRIGREIVVIGAPYTRWLSSNAARVAEYDIAPNRMSAP